MATNLPKLGLSDVQAFYEANRNRFRNYGEAQVAYMRERRPAYTAQAQAANPAALQYGVRARSAFGGDASMAARAYGLFRGEVPARGTADYFVALAKYRELIGGSIREAIERFSRHYVVLYQDSAVDYRPAQEQPAARPQHGTKEYADAVRKYHQDNRAKYGYDYASAKIAYDNLKADEAEGFEEGELPRKLIRRTLESLLKALESPDPKMGRESTMASVRAALAALDNL